VSEAVDNTKYFDGDAIAVSKYFKAFQTLIKEYPNAMMLKGNQILVEKLPKVERKTKSGIIIAEAHTHKNTVADTATDFGLVLMTGPGQIDEKGNDIPTDARVGEIILLPHSTYWYGAFMGLPQYEPYTIGRLLDDQIPMWFGDYKKAYEVLSG
jgi:co-chaperonin GroES (HSP10)